ncbi:flagellar basal body P-ring formation chaperone FlgA [candidate division KSB1 bacterium]
MRIKEAKTIFNKWWTLPLLVVFSVLWIGIGTCSAQTAEIVLKNKAIVPGPFVTLGDVADVRYSIEEYADRLEKIQLSIAPPVNIPLRLESRMIEYKLREHQVDIDQVRLSGAPGVEVTLESMTLPGDSLLKAALEFLEEAVKVPNGRRKIQFLRTPPSIAVPKRELSVKVSQHRIGRLKGTFTINVGIFNGDRQYRVVPVYAQVQTFEPMIVAVKYIPMGKIITPEDVALIEGESTQYNYDLVSDAALVVGKQAKISISENSPVLLKNLDTPPLIKRGDLVSIELKRGNIVITCKGIANRDGRLGDTIPVKRLDSTQVYNARVMSTTKVSIQ